MNNELIEYYVNLLIIQYANHPKARATISALINVLMLYDVLIAIRDGYDIDTAIGAQLDILGKYIGMERTIRGVDFLRDYFGYADYDDTSPFTYYGYSNYDNTVEDVSFRLYSEENQSILILIDAEYRALLKMKIKNNYRNPSLSTIDEFIYEIIGSDATVDDNEDGTIDFNIPSNKERIATITYSQQLLPVPAGVEAILNFV